VLHPGPCRGTYSAPQTPAGFGGEMREGKGSEGRGSKGRGREERKRGRGGPEQKS